MAQKLAASSQACWTALCKSLEDCEKLFAIEWGQMEGVHDVDKDEQSKNKDVKEDIIRRHEQEGGGGFSVMTQSAAATTTKKIVQRSLASREAMAAMDPALN